MNDIKEIKIHASRDYTVSIGHGLLSRCGEMIAEIKKPCAVMVVSDSNVAPLYMDTVLESLKNADFTTYSFVFEAGEASKNFDTFTSILECMAENRLTRTDLAVALGGGVTGDMTGFAAASYLRGIDYVQLPTSLLAAVDSSVGGKTAIDIAAGKNLVGAFKQPIAVICDTDAFNTLSDEVFYDGCAESIKYGILGSELLLDIFSSRDPHELIDDIVAESVKIKAYYVENDEFEGGIRRYLNLGHTLGHAIERCSNFSIMHGHAVAAGTVMIAKIGESLGITDPGTADAIAAINERNELPTGCTFTAEELADGALADKKRRGNTLALIIPEKMGKCMTHTINVDDIIDIINKAL